MFLPHLLPACFGDHNEHHQIAKDSKMLQPLSIRSMSEPNNPDTENLPVLPYGLQPVIAQRSFPNVRALLHPRFRFPLLLSNKQSAVLKALRMKCNFLSVGKSMCCHADLSLP